MTSRAGAGLIWQGPRPRASRPATSPERGRGAVAGGDHAHARIRRHNRRVVSPPRSLARRRLPELQVPVRRRRPALGAPAVAAERHRDVGAPPLRGSGLRLRLGREARVRRGERAARRARVAALERGAPRVPSAIARRFTHAPAAGSCACSSWMRSSSQAAARSFCARSAALAASPSACASAS